MATTEEIVSTVNAALNEARSFCCLVRANEFQEECRERINRLAEQINAFRHQAREQNQEHHANLFFGLMMLCECASSELTMWLQLKASEADKGWSSLIVAQHRLAAAAAASHLIFPFEQQAKRLRLLEEVLFPQQIFMSTGLTVSHSECSICGSIYGECDHILGRLYNGEICGAIARGADELREVSVVKEPADRRCRVTSIDDEHGVHRDTMTWKEVPINKEDDRVIEGRRMQCIAAVAD